MAWEEAHSCRLIKIVPEDVKVRVFKCVFLFTPAILRMLDE
jgi:hypothetical protein